MLSSGGLGLSRSLSYGFMARQRQQGKRLNPAGSLFCVSGGDRLREASRKFQPALCRDFPDGNYLGACVAVGNRDNKHEKTETVGRESPPGVRSLLQLAFPYSKYEIRLVEKLHANGKSLHEWVCLHTNKVIAYIAFSNAYHGNEVCGLHLAPMAVTPDFQKQGVGSELLRFALRQEVIKSQALFVLGEPDYYGRFGFEPCSQPVCLFAKNKAHFLSMRNNPAISFFVGYEPEFKTAAKPPNPQGKKRR